MGADMVGADRVPFWIIFDVMGVIFEVGDDTNDLLVPYIQRLRPHITRQQINATYLQASLGRITPLDFWQQVDLGSAYPQVEQAYLDACLTLAPQFLPAAGALSRSYGIALLSNDVDEWSRYLRQRHGLEPLIQAALISSAAGCRKPSPEIYQILLARLAADPRRCVFIDDRPANLRAAALGLRPVWLRRDPAPAAPDLPYAIDSLSALPALVETIFDRTPGQI